MPTRYLTAFLFLPLFALGASDSADLVKKIQSELAAPFPPAEGKPDAAMPHGEFLHAEINDSKTFPGAVNGFEIYVPAQYDPAKPACVLVKLDGFEPWEGTVLDHLIASKEIPVMIAIGLYPGVVWRDPASVANRRAYRFNRSYEFDSVNDHLPDFVINEVFPAVQKMTTHDGRPLKLSPSGNDHAATGLSTGGIGAFTLAWRRPDQFTRVYSAIGTFVSMRGGHDYPALIRKTEPKPIRIFLEDGSADAWNPLFGSWYDANLNMESALSFAGYDVAHAWGTHGHQGQPGQVIFPDVMRWLWRDYPAAIKAGVSQNSTLQEVTMPNEPWHRVAQSFADGAGLAADAMGDVYVSEANGVYRISGDDGKPALFGKPGRGIMGAAVGPDRSLYAVIPSAKKIIAIDLDGKVRTIAEDIAARGIVVTHDGTIYVSEPGAHSDMPSKLWRIKNGEKKLVDQGLASASGIAISPDGAVFYAAERTTQWVYTFAVQGDGLLADKEQHDWLHMTDIPNDSGAEDLAMDTQGNLYVATRMGIQISDQSGRVRAILPLPTPTGAVRSLCFGGKKFDILYATDGTHVYRRRVKVRGYAAWGAVQEVGSQGPY